MNLFLLATFLACSALRVKAEVENVCWLPLKNFYSHNLEAQGFEPGRINGSMNQPVHAARRICPGNKEKVWFWWTKPKKSCNAGITKFYPQEVADLKKDKNIQVLAYPQGTLSWVDMQNASNQGEQPLIVGGTPKTAPLLLCRYHSVKDEERVVVGTYKRGDTKCTLKYKGKTVKRSSFETLVINSDGRKQGMKTTIGTCSKQPSPNSLALKSGENLFREELDTKIQSKLEESINPVKTKKADLPDTNYEGAPASQSMEIGIAPEPNPPHETHHTKPDVPPSTSSETSNIPGVPPGMNFKSNNDDNQQQISPPPPPTYSKNVQPCWQDLSSTNSGGSQQNTIIQDEGQSTYLIRLMWKDQKQIMFAKYSPSATKTLNLFGQKLTNDMPHIQVLANPKSSVKWMSLDRSALQREGLPKTALVIGSYAGNPFDSRKKTLSIHYTLCSPNLGNMNSKKELLLGVANTGTGLCQTHFYGQTVYFTEFHIALQKKQPSGEDDAFHEVQICDKNKTDKILHNIGFDTNEFLTQRKVKFESTVVEIEDDEEYDGFQAV